MKNVSKQNINIINKQVVSINRKIVDTCDAKISIFDRGFLYGDSVYEVTMFTKNKIIFLEEHLDRLEKSALGLFMNLQFSRTQIEQELHKIIKLIGQERIYLRIIITRGEGEISLNPDFSSKQNMIIIGKILPEYPATWYRDGVSVIVADTLRNHKRAIDPNIKSGNYLNNIFAMIEAKESNVFDAIMMNNDGYITEGTTSNIWITKGSNVYTPPVSSGLLEGITRSKILQLQAVLDSKYKIQQKILTKDDLLNADEAFFSSSTKEIIPIVNIDRQQIGNGKPGVITRDIYLQYQRLAYQS